MVDAHSRRGARWMGGRAKGARGDASGRTRGARPATARLAGRPRGGGVHAEGGVPRASSSRKHRPRAGRPWRRRFQPYARPRFGAWAYRTKSSTPSGRVAKRRSPRPARLRVAGASRARRSDGRATSRTRPGRERGPAREGRVRRRGVTRGARGEARTAAGRRAATCLPSRGTVIHRDPARRTPRPRRCRRPPRRAEAGARGRAAGARRRGAAIHDVPGSASARAAAAEGGARGAGVWRKEPFAARPCTMIRDRRLGGSSGARAVSVALALLRARPGGRARPPRRGHQARGGERGATPS